MTGTSSVAWEKPFDIDVAWRDHRVGLASRFGFTAKALGVMTPRAFAWSAMFDSRWLAA
jgi:hypothetical protein